MITSFSQLIQQRYISPLKNQTAESDFRYVIDGAKRMSTLIREMLEYSRWSAKELPMEKVNIQEVMQEVRQNLKLLIDTHEAYIEYESVLPNVVTTNRLLLGQVLQNLIANSIKYRHVERKPHIKVQIQKQDSFTLFSVTDNGMGFEERDQERIFGIFQRIPNKEVVGNGMGLAICKRIIERQGGKIEAKGILGEGATFIFQLPNAEVTV